MSEIRPGSGVKQRRRTDRETTPGRCGNLDYCSLGMQRLLLQVPVSQPFVCPECGGRLRPPGPRWGRRPALLPTLRLAVLLVCSAASLGVGYEMGRMQPVVGPAVRAAEARLDTARALIEQQPAPSGTSAPAAPKIAPPILVSERPYVARAAGAEAAELPHLLHEARFGQVTIACALDAPATRPTCRVDDIRGGDAFSAAALEWLRGLAVQYGPGTREGGPMLLDHRWHVVFQDFAGPPAPPPKATH